MQADSRLRPSRTRFGQAALGPPGSGKTSYCRAARDMLAAAGRDVVLVNLDPASELPPLEADVDVRELVRLEDAMSEWGLGPNGALVRCVEYLADNLDWLAGKLEPFGEGRYFLFDLPGQIELYCHLEGLARIFSALEGRCCIRLCAVHLVDSHHCEDAGKFLSALTVSLAAMMRLGLPHVNLLSKADLLRKRAADLDFGLDYYAQVLDLDYLVETLDGDPISSKYRELNAALASVVQDYGLVSFAFLDSRSPDSLRKAVAAADRANGYGFGVDEKRSVDSMLACALGASANSEGDL